MRLTGKQRKELSILEHFVPEFMKPYQLNDTSVALFFTYSDRGDRKAEYESTIAQESRDHTYTGLSVLHYAKRNRDLAIASYGEDWGTTCTAVDFVDVPRELAQFLAKALNRPGIMTIWRLFNAPAKLDHDDRARLEPLAIMAGWLAL